MNDFISITSSGGYIGRFFWRNSGSDNSLPPWGTFHFLPDNICNIGWAGMLWPVKYIINSH